MSCSAGFSLCSQFCFGNASVDEALDRVERYPNGWSHFQAAEGYDRPKCQISNNSSAKNSVSQEHVGGIWRQCQLFKMGELELHSV